MQTETKALAVRQKHMAELDRDELQPHTYEDAVRAAKDLVESKLWKGVLDTQQQALMVILAGRELGLGLVQAANTFYVVNGKLGMYSAKKIAVLRRAGYKVRCTNDPTHAKCADKTYAEWTAIRDGEPVSATFSLDDAKRMGLLDKGEWKKQPENMLVWRAASRLCDREFSDVVGGMESEFEDEREGPPIQGTIISQRPSAQSVLEEARGVVETVVEPVADELWPKFRAQCITVLGARRTADILGVDHELVEEAPPVDRDSTVAQKLREAVAKAKGR